MNARKYSRLALNPGTSTPYTDPNRRIVRFYIEGREAANAAALFALNKDKGWAAVQHIFQDQYYVDVTDNLADAVDSYLAALPENSGTDEKYLLIRVQNDVAAHLHVFRNRDERLRVTKHLLAQEAILPGDQIMFADIAGLECPKFYDVDIDKL